MPSPRSPGAVASSSFSSSPSSPPAPSVSAPSSAPSKLRRWRTLPGDHVRGSRFSKLATRITPLPDFVQQAMDLSFGRRPVPDPPRRTESPRGQFSLVGGEAQLQAAREARALERKLSGEELDGGGNGKKTKKKRARGKAALFKLGNADAVPLSRSISARGLSRALAGHPESSKRMLALEKACRSVKAKKLTALERYGLSSPASKQSPRHSPTPKSPSAVFPSPKATGEGANKAKKRWSKLKNAVRGTFGLSKAAKETAKANKDMMVDSTDDVAPAAAGATSLSPVATATTASALNGSKSAPRIVLRNRSPRLADGRVVPPWEAPPRETLPAYKPLPRDIAVLRVCMIPREWAEQWLSGRDISPEEERRRRRAQHQATASRRNAKSAMSWEDARAMLPHAHTYLARSGRFETTVLDRRDVLARVRGHPVGPSPKTLREVVRAIKQEYLLPKGGPGPATFDRARADGIRYESPARAVVLPARDDGVLRHQAGPGPGRVMKDPQAFGTRQAPGGRLSLSNHESRIPVTADGGAALATPVENGGPGAAAYDTRPSSASASSGGGVKWSNPHPTWAATATPTPAPHDYHIASGERMLSTTRKTSKGGVIAGKVKSDLDRAILRASRRPGPSDYDVRLPQNNTGARMSTAFPLSDLELTALRASETPGPGGYFMSSGGQPKSVPAPGAPRFASGNYPTELDLIIARKGATPGAGAYKPDFFKNSTYRNEDPQIRMKHPPTETPEEAQLRRASKLPGPARYYTQRSVAARLGAGGRFSTAFPPTELTRVMKRSAETPGPADYLSSSGVPDTTPHKPGPKGSTSGLGAMMRSPGVSLSRSERLPTMTALAARAGARTPGPGVVVDDSYVRRMIGGRVGRISEAQTKSEVEWAIARASSTPGPDEYSIKSDFGGDCGARFSTANTKSDLEWKIHRAKQTPGPDQYHRASTGSIQGGRFSAGVGKSELDWVMLRGSRSPAPHDTAGDVFAPFGKTLTSTGK